MPCTEARRLANQRNAQKSTGPTTEAGKLVARLNSLTHGLRSEAGLVPPHLADAVARHGVNLADAYRPEGRLQTWLLDQAADAAARLDHCQFMIRAQFDDMADRADLCWDEDQERAVEDVAARLAKDPGRVASRLRESARGCRWLLARWDALSRPLAEHVGWDEDQCNLAATLMGVGPDLRASYPELATTTDPDDLTALLDAEIDALRRLLIEAIEPLDAKARELTRMGFPLRPSKELLRLERYEVRLRRVWTESMAAFRVARAERYNDPEPITAMEPEPIAEPKALQPPEPEPSPVAESVPSVLDEAPEVATLMDQIRAIETGQSLTPPPARQSSALPQSPAPGNRKARRAREKAARKAKAGSR